MKSKLLKAFLGVVWLLCLGIVANATTTITVTGPDTVCQYTQTNYSVTATSGITYTWAVTSPNTIPFTTSNSCTVQWNGTGTATVTVTGKDASNTVQETGTRTVHVFPNPSPVITTSYRVGCNALSEEDSIGETRTTKYFILDDTKGCVKVCDSSVVVYHAKGDTTGTILWAVTGGTILSGQGTTTLTVQWGASPTLGTLSLTETSLAGCSTTKTICIEIIEKPQASFCVLPDTVATDSVVICVNSPVVFKDLSTSSTSSPIISWLWNFGDGSPTSNLHPNVSHTYATDHLYTAYLVVTNECGCTDTFFTKVNVLPDQGPDITCVGVVCENETATYHTSPGCGSYTWSVNGGTIVSGAGTTDIQVKWDAVGPTGYGYVSLSTSCGRCPGSTTIKIPVIQSNPVVTGPTVLCTNKPYKFSIPLWPGTQYQWGVIGNPSAVIAGRNSNEVSLQFTSAGTYTVHITYQNKLKLCGGDLQFNVTVTDPPVITGDTLACKSAGITHTYTLSSGSGSWTLAQPNGGYQYGTGSSFNATFPVSGTYTLSAAVSGSCPPDPLIIVVNDNPINVDIFTGPTIVCHDLPYTYTAGYPISGTHFEWYVTPNAAAAALGYSSIVSPPSGNSVSIQFTTPGAIKPVSGTYWTLHIKRVSNTLPYCEGTDTAINIYPIIVAPNITGATSVCANSYVNYSANWPGATNYVWQIIPNTTGSVMSGNHSNNMTVLWNNSITTTSAMLIVTVTQCNDVVKDTLYPIGVAPAPTVALSISPNPLCGDNTATLTATAGAASYTFNFGDGSPTYTTSSNSTTHFYANPTTISTLTATVSASGGGCAPSGTAYTYLTLNPTPYAAITSSTSGMFCNPNPVEITLTAVGSGGTGTLSYAWTKNGTAYSTSPSFSLSGYGALGAYAVTVTDGTCSSTSGAFVVDTQSCTTPCTPSGSVTINSLSQACGSITGSASGSGGGTSPQWVLSGVGVVSTTSSLSVNYTTPGTYIFEYSEDFGGCRAATTMSIDVPVKPNIKVQWVCPTTLGGNYSLKLIDNSQKISTYSLSEAWAVTLTTPPYTSYTGGTGSPYTLSLPAGTYTIDMTVTATYGAVSDVCSTSVTATAPTPITSITTHDSVAGGSSVSTICESVPVNFYVTTTPSVGISSAAWNFGDGSTNNVYPTQRTFTYTGTTPPNTNSVTVTIVDVNGCSYTPSATTINVWPNILGGNIAGATISCGGSPVSLTFNPSTGYSPYMYLWSTGSTSNPTNVYTTGAYHVKVTDNYMCQFTSGDYGVTFISVMQPQITGFTDYCVNDVVRLSGSIGTSSSYSYQWYRNTSPIATGPSIADVGLAAGTYLYYVVVTYTDPVSSLTCSETSSVYTVTVHPTPAPPTITGPIALDCNLYQLQLSGSHTSGATQYFNWSNGISGQLDTIYSGGPYRLWYTDIYGCTSHADVSVPYSPESYFDWFPTGCYDVCNSQLPLTMYGPPGIWWYWSWLKNYSTVSSGSHTVMAPLSINGSGVYNMHLDNGLCAATTDDLNVNVVNCDNCPPLILNGHVMCDPTVPGGYTINLNMIVSNPGTSGTIGTDIGPTVPFSTSFTSPGTYSLTLNFTTLTIPPPSTVTVMVRYHALVGKRLVECYDTIQLSLPDCTGMWQAQRQANVSQTQFATGLMVYPNPATSAVNVSYNYGSALASDGARRIVVYDLTGKPVYTARISDTNGSLNIPVNGLAAAVYILRMEENGKAVQTQRISVTH